MGSAEATPKKSSKSSKTSKASKSRKKAATKKEDEDVVNTMKEKPVSFLKSEFISNIAEKTGLTKVDSEAALTAVTEIIQEEIAAGKGSTCLVLVLLNYLVVPQGKDGILVQE